MYVLGGRKIFKDRRVQTADEWKVKRANIQVLKSIDDESSVIYYR